MLKDCLKTCDHCSKKFFYIEKHRVVCEGEEDAFFCSSYCQRLWLEEQFAALERMLEE